MSLQVWLPLNGNLNNQGLSDITVTGGIVNDTGILGKCYACTSSNYIAIRNTVTDKYDFSFSFWMKVPTTLSSTGAWNTMFSFRALDTNDSSTENNVVINWANYNSIKIYDDANHQDIWMYPGNQFNYDKWCHYTITHTGNDSSTTIKVYTDGILRGTFNNSHRLVLRSGDILLGSGINPSYGPIYFNDFRLYDHCLSAKEVKEISKGLICHYKLDNNGFGNPNLCNPSLGEFTGVVPASFYNTFLEQRAITTANANDTYTLSYYAKASIDGITLTNHLYNNASNIVQVSYSENSDGYTSSRPDGYSLIRLTTSYKKYWVKWVFNSASTSATKDLLFRLQSELNTSSAGATVTIKNVKLEKGSVATPWCPHTSDSLYTSLGLDSTTESDCSGYKNDGNKIGNVLSLSESGRYNTSTYCKSSNIGTSTPKGAAFIKCALVSPIINATALTINWWGNIEDYSYQNSGILSLSNDPSYPSDYMTSALAQYDSIFRFNLTDGNDSSIDSLALIETGSWHMYTLVFNNGIVQGYRDGVSIISNSKSGTLAQFTYVYMGINVAGGAHRQTKSKWSDFRIYSTALSASDIKELYNTSASIDKNGNMYAYEFKEE